MTTWAVRKDWLRDVPGMELFEICVDDDSSESRQRTISYEPGDSTHYLMSLVPARWAMMTGRLGTTEHPYWQIGVWSGSGCGNGTMLVVAGADGSVVQDSEFIRDELRCSKYSARVFSIMIHGCLASHNPERASELMAQFREAGRMGFVGP